MMNAVGGTTLHYWAQSWRLNPWDFKVVSETTAPLRRGADPEGLDRRGLAVRAGGARALLRQGGVRGRHFRPGRQHQRQDRSARQHLRGRRANAIIRCRRCAGTGVHRDDGGRPHRSSAGTPFPDRRRSIRSLTRTVRAAHYHGFCNRGGCHVNAKKFNRGERRSPRRWTRDRLTVVTQAHRHDRRSRREERPRQRRQLPQGRRGDTFSRPTSCCSRATPTRTSACCSLSKSKRLSERAVEQRRPGRQALLQP